MIVYTDKISGDEMFADSYPMREVEDGFFYEVDGAWQTVGDVDVDIGANPSAEDAEEGVESTSRKVVDIVDSFRLVEQPSFDKKQFMAYVKPWLGNVLKQLEGDEAEEFKTKSQPAIKFLIGKIKELQFFSGESMDPEATMAYAYYKDGSEAPTFLFPKYALKAQNFIGESMDPDASMAYAYYKEGAECPTFLFPRYALKGTKC